MMRMIPRDRLPSAAEQAKGSRAEDAQRCRFGDVVAERGHAKGAAFGGEDGHAEPVNHRQVDAGVEL